jgi:hypothetical protein
MNSKSEDRRERAIRDVWERTLSQIPTTFGRMAYLASLRDENSGRYRHFGMEQVYSESDADYVLRVSHEGAFREWLSYSLERQQEDLEQYLEAVNEDRAVVLSTWSSLAPYRNLIPSTAAESERELYLADLEIILELLRNEAGRGLDSRSF